MTTKRCAQHLKRFPAEPAARPLAEFGKRAASPDGLRYECRRCINADNQERRAAAPAPAPKPAPSPLDEAYRQQQVKQERAKKDRQLAALVDENTRLRQTLEQVQQIEAPTNVTIYSRAPSDMGDAVACALASDWHVEEPVEAHKVHGLNEFNLEIAEARAAAFFRNFLRLAELQARDCDVKRLYLGLLGDTFSNWIHEELRESNLLGPADAANFVLEQLVKGFEFLLRESAFAIDCDAIPGNHGRMTVKPRMQGAVESSLESFMYAALAMRFRDNPRVRIQIARSKMVYRRFFERFLLRAIHGDDVKFGGGVGGITIPIRKKLAAWDKAQPATLTVMGHFHQRIDGGDFLVNGSLIGYNEFAQAIGASPEEPQQAFFLIHARNGGQKSVVAPIWLDDSHRKRAPLEAA